MESSDADHSRLIAGYLDAKRQLALAFQAFVIEEGADDEPFVAFATRLEVAATAVYPRVPARYRNVAGFGAAHRRLFGYLAEREDRDVPIEELRLLTRDAVHTERRLRELRDLGALVTMSEVGGQRTCRMQLPTDLSAAAHQWIARKINADGSLDEVAKNDLLHVLDSPN
ncbi:hypothetical protein E3O53_07880 [Cryobacterium sp. TMT2-18-3]|uniref:hypothetical protein n=1 Tax=unclassified Cryobacterium TaxID=2649013 RepID=UPI00106DA148|nr:MULTISPECIES: hypothetical protein [unclassified Cryobacterium]TFC26434.1 hypothetical protein E3O22_12430 [Cryobacterium sp. TMT2-18-2]TFC64388.1 hypothetical protein E3O53_07880 [Cryobacterium sp. TMT2-18-3]